MPDDARPWSARTSVSLIAAILLVSACSADDPGAPPSPTGVPIPTGVASPSGSSAASPSPTTDSETTAIDGIYSVTISERDATDAGVPKGRLSEVVGDYELDLVRGQLAMYFTGVITLDLLRGTYSVRGHELELESEDGPTLQLTWARDPGGMRLTLEDTDQPADRATDDMIFSTHTWTKIG
jgi:hypothetical protein